MSEDPYYVGVKLLNEIAMSGWSIEFDSDKQKWVVMHDEYAPCSKEFLFLLDAIEEICGT